MPVLAAFIIVCPKDSQGQLHEDVRKVISHIVCCALRPFDHPVPSACSYPSPDSAASAFSYFPHLPQRHGGIRLIEQQCYEAMKIALQNFYWWTTRAMLCCRRAYASFLEGISGQGCSHDICWRENTKLLTVNG